MLSMLKELLDQIQEGFKSAPFMMAAAGSIPPVNAVNKIRIIEAVITAAVSGALIAGTGYFIALPVLEERMAQSTRQMVEIKVEVKELRTEIRDDRIRTAVELRATNDRMQRMEIEAARRGPRAQ